MTDNIQISYNNLKPELQDPLMAILQKMAQTMIDGSKTLVGCHEIASLNPQDTHQQEKLNKIHEELTSTLDNFRDRFAIVLGDIKYLTNDGKKQQDIRNMSNSLKSTAQKPNYVTRDLGRETMDLMSVIEPNLAQDSTDTLSKRGLYDSPRHLRTRDRYNSSAGTKQTSYHNDYPAYADKFDKPVQKYNPDPPLNVV